MGNYDSNYAIAQEISARLGNEPIPFDSVYSICLQIYQELGGTEQDFDSVYSILLEILPLVDGGISSQVIDDSTISLSKTWSSSKINTELGTKASIEYVDEQIEALAGTANSDIEGKQTEDFTFVQSLPVSGEENQLVVIKGDNTDSLYKYVSGEWVEQTPDANKLYFDVENEALYSYVTAQHQFAPVSLVNTIVVGSNLNSNADLKALKTPGVYSVVQRLHNATKGDYIKNWTLYVESVDYEEYDKSDSVYQRLVSNYTIQKRTWSATRASNDGWSSFSTYYAGEIKDTTTSKYYTWSSSKLNTQLGAKQDTLTAGDGIGIDASGIISVEGIQITNDPTNHKYNFATYYYDDDTNQLGINTANGGYSNWAEGSKTTAASRYGGNHAEGYSSSATGQYGSHSEGAFTSSSGQGSHAEGYTTSAIGQGSHAEGVVTSATGIASHAEGNGSHSHNYPNTALGVGSHVEGVITIARNKSEHAEGTCNISHKASDNMGDSGNTLSSIGFSLSDNWDGIFMNAREVMQNADMYIYGIGGYDGVHIKGEVSGITVQTVQDVVNGLETSVAGKQDILTAGTNIEISGTTISATYQTATNAEVDMLFVQQTTIE